MKTNLMRTAYNLIIYEALDFTVGLFTPGGRHRLDRPGPADVHPRHVGNGQGEDHALRQDDIQPGDILVTNDAYTTGSHLNHFTFTLPVFHDGELVGFTCCMAHWLDVGGTLGDVTHRHLFAKGSRSRS